MKNYFKKNLLDYLILLTSSVFFLIALSMFQGERLESFVVVALFVSFYIIWGIYYHVSEKTLRLKSVIEYIFIGFTILLLLIFVFSL